MSDLRGILGDKYDDTIEKVVEVIADETDYLGCGCCSFYDYDEAVKRTGHRDRPHMAAHDALAAVLPDLLLLDRLAEVVRQKADAWDEAVASMRYEDGTPVQLVSVVNPYRPEPTTGRPEPAPGSTNSPNPTPSATQHTTEPHNTEGA